MNEAQPTRNEPVKELAKLLRESGAKVQIGLEAQGHIPTVEEMFAKGKSWDEIGKTIGWEGSAVCQWYIYYLRRKREAVVAELEQVRQAVKGGHMRPENTNEAGSRPSAPAPSTAGALLMKFGRHLPACGVGSSIADSLAGLNWEQSKSKWRDCTCGFAAAVREGR